MNNKGFAISGIMYGILIIFIILIFGVLNVLSSRKVTLDKVKENAINTVVNADNGIVFSAEWNTLYIQKNIDLDAINFDFLANVSTSNKNVITYTTNVNTAVAGNYNVTYSVKTKTGLLLQSIKKKTVVYNTSSIVTNYVFTGDEQKVTLPIGAYKFEAWGAQGGDNTKGGKGAYTTGIINFDAAKEIFVYVGGQGAVGDVMGRNLGGYNGGGQGYTKVAESITYKGSGGGGSTDFRLYSLSFDRDSSLASRIMVAAGGGGYSYENNGFAGGGLTGLYSAGGSTGGTQIAGGIAAILNNNGTNGGFGYGGDSGENSSGGGGSGYYGGAGASHATGNNLGGPSGSSYVSGYTGCVAIKALNNISPKTGCTIGTTNINCSYHYSNLKFTSTNMISGSLSMPTYDGSTTMIGNTGNGYAKITTLIYYQ